MAGFYPDVPAPRMAYDRDGSKGFVLRGNGTVYELTTAHLASMNNDIGSPGFDQRNNGGEGFIGLIFPQLRNIRGLFMACGDGADSFGASQWSTNTTNGADGTWTNFTFSRLTGASSISIRQNITAVNLDGVKGIRHQRSNFGSFSSRYYVEAYNIYGALASPGTFDQLRMWHPTLDEPLDDATSADGAFLDWGDVVRGTSGDRIFRIKNQSTTLTANSVTVSTEVITNTSPLLESQFTYSYGGSFAPSVNIGNLTPGAVSQPITVRRSTLSNAALSVWTLRTVVEAGSWS